MDKAMKQRDVALLLGCTEQSIRFWEQDKTTPIYRYLAKVIEFVGYDPFPPPETIGEKVKRYRAISGLTQQQLAEQLAVDESTIRGWENGLHRPIQKMRTMLAELWPNR